MSNFDSSIAVLLRIGVLASLALFIAGLFLPYPILLSLGIYTLVATPVIRVALSIFLFAMQKNLLYAIIPSIVLINLLVAIFLLPHLPGIVLSAGR
jgi:uncharacterized membrane protein